MRAHHSDSGTYTCRATNVAGEAEAKFELLILGQ
jgi:hypothetical protein